MPTRCVAGWLISGKVLYLVILGGGLWLWGNLDQDRFYAVHMRWPREGKPVFASHFATWDSAHYLGLSELGYIRRRPSCAFYPLWPMAVRLSAPLTGGHHVLAGVVLANLCSLTAWLLLYRHTRHRWGEPVARWTLAFLIAFPGSLFFQFHYSESLFLLLVTILWIGLDQRRYGAAALAAVLAPMTRAVGVFALLPLGWQWLRVAAPGALRTVFTKATGPLTGGEEPRPREVRCAWLLLLAPLMGWGIYLAFMWCVTGNPFEGFWAQRYWGVHSVWNLVNLPRFVAAYFVPTEWHEFSGSLLDRCVFLVLLHTIPVLWRLDRNLLVWVLWLGVVPALSGSFTSYTRFASCAFPMFLGLAVYFHRVNPTSAGRPRLRRIAAWALLATFALLHVLLVWRHTNFRWAG